MNTLSRRRFVRCICGMGILPMSPGDMAAGAALVPFSGALGSAEAQKSAPRRPIIDITDLYHPPQDPGDNFDLIAAYALPEVDLRAVIFDVTERFRRPFTTPDGQYCDPTGPRDPGFIPVAQLNYIFNRNVPCAAAPFAAMRAPDDTMRDAPGFQQAGIELLIETLRTSAEPVHIVSFGSARPLAVAYNREPALLREKTALVHLCAGAAPAGYIEWNVQLDPHAFVRILRSDLPVAIYPCATDKGPFDLGHHNCFWKLENLHFIREMAPRLQRYCAFAFERSARSDFLVAMDEDAPEDVFERVCGRPHNVWETAVWASVSGRRLMRHEDGTHRLLATGEVLPGDTEIPDGLRACRVDVRDDGQFDFELVENGVSNFSIYHRPDPKLNETALREALPALYASFRP